MNFPNFPHFDQRKFNMPTLYVIEQGARIEKEYRRILVTKEDEVLQAIPLRRVSHVVLVGNVGTTTPALLALLREDVGLSLVSRWGKMRGRLLPATGKNIVLRQRQYARAAEPDFCLALGRQIVEGKLKKFYEEACLLNQKFVKDPAKTVSDRISETIAKLGENVKVSRFVRFQLGEK